MSGAGQLAFANVRARTRAARLLGPEAAAHLRAAHGPVARSAALRVLGLSGNAVEVHRTRVARLLEDYAVLAVTYPVGSGLLVALARLHEIENLKLLFRAAVRGWPKERWRPLWRPLGRLAALRLPEAEEVRTVRDLVAVLAPTPYAALVAAVGDGAPEPSIAEISFDRLGSRRLVEEARRLPRGQAEAGALVLDLVRERDLDLVRRAAGYGIAPEQAAGMAVLLADEPGGAALADLATWTAADGPLGLLLPRRLLPGEPVESWEALVVALRRRRYRACRAAFIGSPFRVAVGVAYLLLAEAEVRGLTALIEDLGDPGASGVLERALAGSGLGG